MNRQLFDIKKNLLKLHEKKSKQLHLENALSLEYFFHFLKIAFKILPDNHHMPS